ncbi:MAG: septal ring lytic transglycosylase RlpA family protein [Rhodocyclaceae bacterium]|nr:septal ring lytic transglycosylase RlpA family protein [Rhodocyclaceae bacterium]MDZ4216148.1 septal ring lytic transglycosylase RlpA family protein [Rhodocyclaceae bacterium]
MKKSWLLWLLAPFVLAACGTQAPKPVVESPKAETPAAPPAPTFSKGGGYYKDDGPLDTIPVDLASVPDAIPRHEPPHRFANRPYNVLGRDYVPLAAGTPYRREGIASWYGRKFHGQKTSSGEPYDMFGMTAAHPTLPIPSYVRVTRPDTGKTVTVRVNDRGPFLHDRVIDLSYTAAWKLGLIGSGSGRVVVESVVPGVTPLPEHAPIQVAENKSRPEEPTVLRDVEEKSGHFLQLGAFGSRDNAESLRIKLARELGELGERLTIRSSGSLHRLQLGPWADIAEARRVAEQLKSAFDLPSVLVK